MLSWLISWRNLTRRKLRTFFTLLAVMIGVASTLAVTTTVDSTKQAIEAFINEFNMKSDLVIQGTEYTIPEEVAGKVKGIEGVDSILTQLYLPVRLDTSTLNLGGADQKEVAEGSKVLLHGYDSVDNAFTGFKAENGDLTGSGLIVDETTAEIWGVKAGDQVTFLIDDVKNTVTVSAVVKNNDRLGGPDDWAEARTNRWDVVLPLQVVQDFAGQPDQVRYIDVKAKENRKDQVMTQVEEAVKAFPGVYVEPVLVDENSFAMGMDDLYDGLYLLGALGILMSAIILFSTMYVSVFERKREFAIMKSLGYTSNQIGWTVMREVMMLALIGTAVGLLCGVGLSYGLTAMMFDMFEIETDLVLSLGMPILLSTSVGVIVSIAAGVVPLLHSRKVSVAVALKPEVVEQQKLSVIGFIMGLLLLGAGFYIQHPVRVLPLFSGLLMVFPALLLCLKPLVNPFVKMFFRYEGQIASQNVSRQRNRVAMAAAILCMGISFIVIVNFVSQSMQQSIEATSRNYFGGDAKVRLTNPITDADVKTLEAIAGIQFVSPFKEASVTWKKDNVQRSMDVFSVNEDYEKVVPMFTTKESTIGEILTKLSEPNTVVLGKSAFTLWNGSVGENIELQTSEGLKSFKVVAQVDTVVNNGNVVFAHMDRFTEQFGVQFANEAVIMTEPGADMSAMRTTIFNTFQENLSSWRTLDSYTENRKESIAEPFMMMNILLALVLVVAGIGILNTLQVNVMERTREIGMMRAVAATRSQIKKVILGEGVFIGVAGVVIGTLLGVLVSYATAAFTDEMAGIDISFTMPWLAIVFGIVFGIAVSFISALLPASRAAKVRLSEALKYE